MTNVEETYIENRVLVQPDDTNNYDMAHGGNVMKWMDEVGAMSAMRFAGETCVTARMESVDFHRPIPRGDAALIESYVYDAGKTSAKVRLRVFREDPLSGDRELTTESYAVYVAIDADGHPTSVPSLEIETDRDETLRETALTGEAESNGHEVGVDR
jgi:acyl-CoA hydrolase